MGYEISLLRYYYVCALVHKEYDGCQLLISWFSKGWSYLITGLDDKTTNGGTVTRSNVSGLYLLHTSGGIPKFPDYWPETFAIQ